MQCCFSNAFVSDFEKNSDRNNLKAKFVAIEYNIFIEKQKHYYITKQSLCKENLHLKAKPKIIKKQKMILSKNNYGSNIVNCFWKFSFFFSFCLDF